MRKKNNLPAFNLIFPKEIVQLMEDFFQTSFKDDIEAMKQGEKHPAHELNDRIRPLTNIDDQCPPVGIDLPVLIKPEIAEPKPTVVLLGQDPLRKCKDVDKNKVFSHAFVGTPYRVHHTQGLPPTTTLYPKLINSLLEEHYSVYLTDVRKYYPSPQKVSKQQMQDDMDLLVHELCSLKTPLILILSGREAKDLYKNNINELKGIVDCKHVVCLPHLSSYGSSSKWKKLVNETTHDAKIDYVIKQIKALNL